MLGFLRQFRVGKESHRSDPVVYADLYHALSRERFNEVAHGDAVIATKVFARLALLVSRRLRGSNAELLALEQR